MKVLKTKQRTYHIVCLILFIFALGVGSSSAYAQGKVSVQGVDAVGMTVSDMDRSVDFYSNVIGFKKISVVEVHGDKYEHLEGVLQRTAATAADLQGDAGWGPGQGQEPAETAAAQLV